MAASTLNKKTGIIIAAVVVVAVLAFGIVRYIENTVENTIRELVATNGQRYQAKVETVSYSLLQNRLELTNISGQYPVDTQTVNVTIKQLEVLNPNRSMQDLITDTSLTAQTPLADKCIMTNYLVSMGKDVRAEIASYSISKLETNPVKLREALSEKNADDVSILLPFAFSYAEAKITGIAIDAIGDIADKDDKATPQASNEKPVTVSLSCDEALATNVQGGSFESMQMKAMTIRIDGKDALRMNRLRADNGTTPDPDLLKQISILSADPSGNPEVESKLLTLIEKLFVGPKPLLEKLTFSGITAYEFTEVTPTELGHIAEIRLSNPLTKPFTFRMEMDHLIFPTKLLPDSASIEQFGLKEIDISTQLGLSGPKSGDLYDMVLSMSLAKVGTLLIDITPVLTSKTLAALSDDVESEAEDVPLARMEINFKDEGFMGKAAKMATLSTGIPPAMQTKWAEQILRAQLAATPEQMPLAQKLLDDVLLFLEKPGQITLRFAPPHPMTLTGNEEEILKKGYLTFSVTPGPKTLSQLAEEENNTTAAPGSPGASGTPGTPAPAAPAK